jgi:hypothetical protein
LEDLGLDGKIILKCIWRGMDWIDLAQDRKMWRGLVRAVMYLRVVLVYNAGNFLTSSGNISFKRRTLLHAVS